MSSWSDGYVVDSVYTESTFPMMRPVHLSMASVFGGQPPRESPTGGTYMELGCGNGMTAAAIAASCPEMEVWACDFNPAHVDRGSSIARRAGLENCAFEERSFLDLVTDRSIGPRRADVIALHGVWSWVSDAARRELIEVVRDRLAPGGLLYVSYLTPTAWDPAAPLREVMRHLSLLDHRRTVDAVPDIVGLLAELRDAGAEFALTRQEADRILEAAPETHPYFVHEYLNASTRPEFAAEVAGQFGGAKCDYVGNVTLGRTSPAAMAAVLAESGHGPFTRQVTRVLEDLWSGDGFNVDLFRRGLASLTQTELRRHEDDLWMSLAIVRERADERLPPIAAQTGLPMAALTTVVDSLARGPMSFGSGVETAVAASTPDRADAARVAVAALVGSGIASATVAPSDDSAARVSAIRFNEVILDEVRHGRIHDALASPMAGGPVLLGYRAVCAVAGIAVPAPTDPAPTGADPQQDLRSGDDARPEPAIDPAAERADMLRWAAQLGVPLPEGVV